MPATRAAVRPPLALAMKSPRPYRVAKLPTCAREGSRSATVEGLPTGEATAERGKGSRCRFAPMRAPGVREPREEEMWTQPTVNRACGLCTHTRESTMN
jgi:hypothetical protein